MICPYAVNCHCVQQTVYEYNDDGTTKMHQTIEHNNAEFIECKQEGCGAWCNGRCNYGNINQ